MLSESDHPIETPPRAPSPVHKFGTLAVHAGSPHDPVTGAVIESVGVLQVLESNLSSLRVTDISLDDLRADSSRQARGRIRIYKELQSQ